MPFKSKAQQRFLFATNPAVAREFAAHTDFAKLPERKGKKPRAKHAALLAPAAVDPVALAEKLAAGLGRLPGSPGGLVRPTLKPQGMTLSALKTTAPRLTPRPPAPPALSATPAPSPLGGGQLGEQTAQQVVQTARRQAPNPAQVRPVGLPGSPANPQGMPKVGSHALAHAALVAALIRGPGHGPTPHPAPDTGAPGDPGGCGEGVKAADADGLAAPDTPIAHTSDTSFPGRPPAISAHIVHRPYVLWLTKMANPPPPGGVLDTPAETSPLSGASPRPAVPAPAPPPAPTPTPGVAAARPPAPTPAPAPAPGPTPSPAPAPAPAPVVDARPQSPAQRYAWDGYKRPELRTWQDYEAWDRSFEQPFRVTGAGAAGTPAWRAQREWAAGQRAEALAGLAPTPAALSSLVPADHPDRADYLDRYARHQAGRPGMTRAAFAGLYGEPGADPAAGDAWGHFYRRQYADMVADPARATVGVLAGGPQEPDSRTDYEYAQGGRGRDAHYRRLRAEADARGDRAESTRLVNVRGADTDDWRAAAGDEYAQQNIRTRVVPALARLDDAGLADWMRRAPAPTRLLLAQAGGDPRIARAAYAGFVGDRGAAGLRADDLEAVGRGLAADPAHAELGGRVLADAERVRDHEDVAAYAARAEQHRRWQQVHAENEAAERAAGGPGGGVLGLAERWHPGNLAADVLGGGSGVAERQRAEFEARVAARDRAAGVPADGLSPPRLQRGRVWLPGVDRPMTPGVTEAQRPFDQQQAAQFGTWLQQQEAGGRMRQLPAPQPGGKVSYQLPEELGGGTWQWAGEGAGPRDHAHLAHEFMQQQARGFGWTPPSHALQSTASPFEYLAGLGGFARAGAGAAGGARLAAARPAGAEAAAVAPAAVAGTEAAAALAPAAVAPAAVAGAEAAAPGLLRRAATATATPRAWAANALDPLSMVAPALARYGAGEGVLPALARWAYQPVRGLAAIPRYTTGMAAAGNALRGNGVMAGLGGIAPLATAGLTGTSFPDSLAAPFTYPGRWARAVGDLFQGNAATAGNLVGEPFRRLGEHTLDPLNRVAGNAAANAEHWYEPVTRPAAFLWDRVWNRGVGSLLGANRTAFGDPTVAPSRALQDAARAAGGGEHPADHPLTGDPANPAFQNRATDYLPAWLGGRGGAADEATRRGRADAHIARRAAGGSGGGTGAGPAPPPGLSEADAAGLADEHEGLLARGDLAGAEAVRTRMLDAVGGDVTRLPLSAAAADLDHTAFPGMTPEQFGAMVDQGEGLGAGAYARYQAGTQELERLRAGLRPGDAAGERAFEEKRQQLLQLRRQVQGRAAQHYENAVLRPMLHTEVPQFEAAYRSVQERLGRGETIPPEELQGLQARSRTLMTAFGDHALRRMAADGVRAADGTPVRTAAEFLQEASRTRPVVGPDGRPVTRVVDGPAGPVRVPVTEPAAPVGRAIQAQIDRQVLAAIPGRATTDGQGRPATERLVDPAVSHTIFERMDDQSRMLTYAGLGLGAIGLLGSMFGFGGSWLPLLGLLGGGFGLYKATGGDLTQLGRGAFWQGLAGGVTGDRGGQDAATLAAMARPHDAAGGAAPLGQVSLESLRQSPLFTDLVGGRLPAAQTLQAIAAVRPHEREQLRQLAGPNPAVGRMIDQVAQFEAQRGAAADRAAAVPASAPQPGAGGGPGRGGGLRDYYATMGVTGGSEDELNRNVTAWLARASDDQVRQAVAGMPPAARQEAVAGLAARVQEAGGWGRVHTGAAWGHGEATQALRLGRLLGVPEAGR